MKIQLLHPPHPSATDDRLDAPLGLLYVAAAILQAGHEVVFTDLCGMKNEKDWHRELVAADIYGISSYVCTMGISESIAKAALRLNPEAWIVGGGANFTGLAETGSWEYIPGVFNSIVVGAGELAILDFINDIHSGRKPKLVYEKPLGQDLDQYIGPGYDLVDLDSYHRTIGGEKSITILTTRGCPFHCNFCGLPSQSRVVRYRSAESVAQEIKYIIDRFKIKAFNFQDDTFIVNKKRVKKLMDLIGPLDIQFRCLGRAGLDTEEDYKILKDAGCQSIAWGIESGSQRMLDLMNKQVTVADNYKVIEWAKKHDILDRIFIVVGFPGETRESLDQTKDFINNSDPSQYIASTFQPYPGIPVWKDPGAFGVTKIYTDFSKYIQVNGFGLGGHCNIDTVDWTREQFQEIQTEFRQWLASRKLRGPIQEYEKKLTCMRSN